MFLFYLVLTGIVSGILGGMGMGGGTLLIPLLTFLFGFNQKMVQGINLISFSIMAIFVLIVHIKNKLVNLKAAIMFVSFAVISSFCGALLANVIYSKTLKIGYGVLLILIALYQAVIEILTSYKRKVK